MQSLVAPDGFGVLGVTETWDNLTPNVQNWSPHHHLAVRAGDLSLGRT